MLMLCLAVKSAFGDPTADRPQEAPAPSPPPTAAGLASSAEATTTTPDERMAPHAERRDVRLEREQLRAVDGRTVDASGRPRAAVLELAGHDGAALHARSDAAGAFTTMLPVTWSKVAVRATAAGGRTGALDVTLPAHDGTTATTSIPDVVLHRRVEFDLTLQVADLAAATGGVALAGTVQAELQDQPRRFTSRDVAVTTFPDVTNDRRTVTVEIPAAQNLLRWMFATPSGSRFVLQDTALPDDAARCADTCCIDASSVLSGRAVDPDGRAVGGMPLVLEQKAPLGQRVEIHTAPDGMFRTVVARGAHGSVLEGEEATGVSWSAGGYVEVPVDARGRIRLQVFDPDGAVVRAYAATRYSDPLRGNDGTLGVARRTPTTADGIQVTAWTTLEAGSRLFVFVPGRGEHLHLCSGPVHGGAVPYVVRLAEPARGELLLRCGPRRDALPKFVNVHLREVGETKPPLTLRVLVPSDAIRDGFTLHGVHGATYDFEIGLQGATPTQTRGRITVAATGRTTLEF